MPTILLVEDDPILLETLEYTLSRQGYEVLTAADGRSALETAQQARPDLIVLDVMLPEIDGFEVCRLVRTEMRMPILMLTARDEEIDRVVGLEMGADDYLTKPFRMRELFARIKALLRRVRFDQEEWASQTEETSSESPGSETSETLVSGELLIDLDRHEAYLGETSLSLKPKEFDLLVLLMRNRGIALSRTQILDRVWDWDFEGGSRTVDVHIRWLREKIEPDPAHPTRILTVRGIGYRFEG